MTIAAGFLCRDGIVLAADTLYTGENKRDAAKLWIFRKGENVVGIAGAGDATLIRRAKHEMERVLSATMSEHAIVNMAGAVVLAIMQPQLQVDKEATCSLLLGIRTADGLSLWENGTQGVVFAPVDSKAQCIGCGRSLGLYFADWLFKEHMPATYTRTIAAHLLKQTKQYVPDCGGESHVLMIPAIGEPALVDHTTLVELERQLGNIEEAMRKVLVYSPGVPGADVNAETVEERTKALVAAVDAARGLYVRIQGVAAAGSVGSVSTSPLALEGQRPTLSIGQTSGSTSSQAHGESVRMTEQISAERIEAPSHPDAPDRLPS